MWGFKDTFVVSGLRFGSQRLVPACVAATMCCTVTLVATGTGSAGAATRFTGAPIKVEVQGPFSGPILAAPPFPNGVNAAAQAINKAGGIHGHKVQVVACDTQFNPNREASCIRDATAAGAVVQVGSANGTNPVQDDSLLADAHIAELAPIAIDYPQYQTPIDFPLTFIPGEVAACTSKLFQKQIGSKLRVAPIYTSIYSQDLLPILQHSGPAQGATVLPAVTVGLTTIDFSSQVAQAAAERPNVIAPGVNPNQGPELATAANSSGHQWPSCGPDGSLSAKELTDVTSASGSPYFAGAPYPPPTSASTFPAIRSMIAQLRAAHQDIAADFDPGVYQYVINGWLGMQVFKQVADSIRGPITASSFLAALRHARVSLGVIPPINFARPVGAGAFTRVFSARAYLTKWDPSTGKYMLIGKATDNAFAISGLG